MSQNKSTSIEEKPNQNNNNVDSVAVAAEHGILSKFVGEFDAEITIFIKGQALPATSGKSTGVATWNGNIIVWDFSMDDGAFKGQTRFSFCTTNRKFQSVWIDNSSTGQFVSESRAVAPVVVGAPYVVELFAGERLDVHSGTKKTGRSTYAFSDDGSIVHESFFTNVQVGAKEERMITIKYERK